MRNKVDLVHIGYHKTASTWWQQIGYTSSKDIFLLNSEVNKSDKAFFELFVEPLEFDFKKNLLNFQKELKFNEINN